MEAEAAAMQVGRAHKCLRETGSTSVIFSAVGFLLLPPSRNPGQMVHLFFFYLSALVGISLLFLSATIDNFPTAARATTSVANAIGRNRFRLLGLLIWKRGLQGATFFCSVWFAAALAYAVAKVSLCYYGLAWMSYTLLGMN